MHKAQVRDMEEMRAERLIKAQERQAREKADHIAGLVALRKAANPPIHNTEYRAFLSFGPDKRQSEYVLFLTPSLAPQMS